MTAQNKSIQPRIIFLVRISLRNIQEKITPKTDSKDKNNEAIGVGVYFWQIFCKKKAIIVLKIPR